MYGKPASVPDIEVDADDRPVCVLAEIASDVVDVPPLPNRASAYLAL